MNPEINIKKSLKKDRLVFKTGLFDLYFTYLGSLIFIILSLSSAIGSYGYSILIALPFLLIGIWFILNLFFLTALTKVNGQIKKDYIIKFIGDKYPKLDLVLDDPHGIIRFVKLSTLFGGGKMITVLYNDDDAYLNIINLGRNDSYSPFHGWINHITCKEIARNINIR
jgi:hypothetical protein